MHKSLINKIQSYFAITKTELFIVFILLFGVLLGFFTKRSAKDETLPAVSVEIEKRLDSLAKADTMKIITKKEEIIKERSKPKPKPKPKKKEIGIININKASKSELDKLPGVGPVTAEKIIKYRQKHKFKRPSDIKKVKGIGEKKFEKMKKYIEVR